jgi:hypothetical protein
MNYMRYASSWSLLCALVATAACSPRMHQKSVMDVTPSWYVTAKPMNREKVATFLNGRGAGSSTSQQIALDMAKMSALSDLGRTLDAQFSGLSKQAVEQVGAGRDAETVQHFSLATKVVMADVDVSGTNVVQQQLTQVDGMYYGWVLMEYPVAEANRKFLEELKARRVTYERFRATQLYDEMTKEIEEYREFRKQQPR